MARYAIDHVPSYRLHKQSGQAVVTLSGQDYLLGKHRSPESHAEYARLLAEWELNGRRPPAKDGTAVAVTVIIARFWAHAEKYYRTPDGEDTGELDNFRQALRPLRELYGYTPAAEFSPLKLKAVREQMIAAGWCRNVVNRQTARIRQMFKWAAEEELIPACVFHGLLAVAGLRRGRSGAPESAEVQPVLEQDVFAIKNHVSRQVWAMIELQLLTGMRPGEVCRLRTCDLDMSAKVWLYNPPRHKTSYLGHSRQIRIGPKAQAVLAPCLKPDLQAFVFSPADAERERREALHRARKTPLSCGNKPGSNRRDRPKKVPGLRFSRTAFLNAIHAGCDAAFPPPGHLARARVPARRGKNSSRWETAAEWKQRLGEVHWAELKKWRDAHRWHPNRLRHTAGTKIRKQFGLDAVRAVLGHRSTETSEIYAEIDQAKAEQIMAEVG